MTRVLLLCEYPSLNGGERSLLSVVGGIAACGYKLTLAAPPDGPLAEEIARRELTHIPFSVSDSRGRRYPRDQLRAALSRLIQRERAHLVHANSLSMSRLAGPVAADLGLPSIGHLRDILKLSRAAIDDLNRHTRLLCVSQATRRWHVGQGLDPQKSHVCYNGVDLETFRPRPPTGYLHRELNLPPTAPLIGAVGQIGLRKGLDLLLDAMAGVAVDRADAHLLLIGARYSEKDEARRYEAGLRAAAERSPLAGRVHFFGVRTDIPQILNELTLLAHAARQEPLGRVLLEAAAAGVAVVATDVGGGREIFPPDQGAARLVSSESPSALAEEILALLHDETSRTRMAARARQRAAACFDAQGAARRLAGHYRDVRRGP